MKGTATRISKYGLQLDGQDMWHNWANDYADHPHVEKGQVINIDMNEKGYITRATVLADSPAEQTENKVEGPFRTPIHIIRQGALDAALQAAIHNSTLGDETGFTLPQVLAWATELEKWILREVDPRGDPHKTTKADWE